MNNSLGLYIPNSDYSFQCKKVKPVDDWLFVITKDNEIITYKREDDRVIKISDLKKKFILFTHIQNREEIFDIFVMKMSESLLVNKIL
jgi:hypothetical protein